MKSQLAMIAAGVVAIDEVTVAPTSATVRPPGVATLAVVLSADVSRDDLRGHDQEPEIVPYPTVRCAARAKTRLAQRAA